MFLRTGDIPPSIGELSSLQTFDLSRNALSGMLFVFTSTQTANQDAAIFSHVLAGDVPDEFTVNLLDNAPNNRVIGGSKAVGEPPFLLAISVVTALRHAIAAYSGEALPVELVLPATPEAVLRGIAHQKGEAVD